ncbi:MAG: CPBP family intramembrane metalloprotease [Blastocatellia bacterium]|nr:CPBP family intramembrane metalloprotease [Blastocatellia bacterium]
MRSAIFLVPIANVSVAVREVLVGKHDWLMITLTFIVMTIYAVIAIRSSAKTLSEERLITQNETTIDEAQDGQARFSRHVLQWYLVMWALLFAAGSNLEVLATLQRQLLFNQLFIFLAVPIFIIWRYRLDPKRALSLKSVNLSTWVAVILVVPAGQLLGVGVFRLANLVFPVPPQALEQFGSQIMVNEIPRWQLYLLIALLPAVCEEIAFRGLLLYGLRKRFKPIVLVLVVGLVFGLFHFQLFRIIPTGFLGVVLSGILVMTGSIFPGMVAHAGNNALTIVLAENGFALHKLDVWVYFAAGLVFSLCMYIIYRNRISGD